MRMLVTGAEGRLGSALVTAFSSPHHEVFGLGRDHLDVADRDSVLSAITSIRPDAIVHAAAWTEVDACEADPDRALAVNALGTRHVAEGADRVGARVVYISTGMVFSGAEPAPYNEWDEPGPISVYGRSKLGGERELAPGATIVRTSWLFGPGPGRLVDLVGRARAGSEVRFVSDQRGCPTAVDDLAEVVRHLAVSRLPGTFHVTNQGATSWHGFVEDVFRAAGADPALVTAVTSDELDPRPPAPRGANAVLDNAALRLSGFPLLADYRGPLARMVKELMG